MNFTPLPLEGAYVIELEPVADDRGFFARAYSEDEFTAKGLSPCGVQCNVSFNTKRGTVRGMHYQEEGRAEAKIVRCLRGAVHDVIVDLRPASRTFCKWAPVELTAENRRALYVPEGFAHGFQSLVDCAELFYQMSTVHSPAHARGVRYDDPIFGIEWPLPVSVISDRDAHYDDFRP